MVMLDLEAKEGGETVSTQGTMLYMFLCQASPSYEVPAQPAEGGSTASACHLVTATTLLDHTLTLGAWSCILTRTHPDEALEGGEEKESNQDLCMMML